MKLFRPLIASLALLLVTCLSAQAEDIDLYSAGGGSSAIPNVLIVFDNAANFSSNAAGSSCVIDGVATELSGTVGGIEQCAFYNVIKALPVDSRGNPVVNIGMMVYNANNIRDINNENCGSADGGCLVVPLRPMKGTDKSSLLAWIKTWRTSGGAGDGYIKASGESTASTMQEAWAYYAGQTGLSGRTYSGVQPSAGCQQNFVIFIGNSFGPAGTPGDGGSASPASALNTAPGVTADQKVLITKKYSTVCGSYTFPTSAHESKGFYADEWARYMRQTDIYGTVDGSQSITTYTIGLVGASCQAEYAATLNSMADVGGGKYFATSDYNSIVNALLKILNEVQAVNSVFSSSSLPISTNTQGTYENKIFMGMFRPDGSGNPRWVGNLKQYQFIIDSGSGELKLGDSLGQAAISSTQTGFISPNAVSFWTCGGNPAVRACSPVADPTMGFWANNPQSAGKAYDLPDGELVEKGGAAQVLRLANLTNDYTTAAGTSTNPRKLYTHCPGGASCQAALSHSANAFSTSNTNITAAMFGASSTLRVSSIVRTGTSALVTTTTAHGFDGSSPVTIQGARESAYNVTQTVTINSPTTFTITGLPDYPTTPAQGTYTVGRPNAAAKSISSITRTVSTGAGVNSETATVTTTTAHGFSGGENVQINGATPADYSGVKNSIGYVNSTQFTFPVTIYPTTPASTAAFQAVVQPYSRTIATVTKTGGTATATTTTAHGFHVGQTVTMSGTAGGSCNVTKTITAVTSLTYTFAASGCATTTGGSVVPSTTPVTINSLSRTGTGSSAYATATVTATSSNNPFATGDRLNISYITGTVPSAQAAYLANGVTITCSASPCTSFTYPVTVTPAESASGTMTVALATGTPITIAAGQLTRNGTTAKVTGVANTFNNGETVEISSTGTTYPNENAYLGTGQWVISCPAAGCSTEFTFGPVTLTPTSPAEVANGTAYMTAYSGATPPAKDPLINWVRGQDSTGDELSLCPPGATAGSDNCPSTKVTVRPSIHGDVLHSRPAVINYGGTTGVVVFYGANDGVFRAVNGNQVNPSGSTMPVPGSELWGFIPTEFFSKLPRLQTNTPELLLPTTPAGISPAPMPKDYFIDGMVGVYQVLNTTGTTNKAYVYLSMRRGGRMLYALDVTTPTNPKFLWKIDPTGLTNATDGYLSDTDGDYDELGQTWSMPKVAMVEGYANPVLIFGAGYDTAQDAEPPGTDTMGRGIFILDATTGALVWRATPGSTTACSGTSTRATCEVSGMDFSIPADITLVDRDRNGKVDRLYAADMGGNVWRVDLKRPVASPATNSPANWRVTKLAALGCDTGLCGSGVTPRKFFYPVDIVTGNLYDAVMAGSGDREHPLYTSGSYNVQNEVYMLRDMNVGFDSSGASVITRDKLFNRTCTTSCPTYTVNGTAIDGSTTPNKGFVISLQTGEKVVNAPTTVAGYTYFGTNQATAPTAGTCSNLGNARGYYLSPTDGDYGSTLYSGGGLPPTTVAGLVSISTMVDGVATSVLVPFIIGGGGGAGNKNCTGADCKSAFGGGKPPISVPTSRTRTYWYREVD